MTSHKVRKIFCLFCLFCIMLIFVLLFQALYLCNDPPGYESLETISKKYPLVDITYKSVMPWKLPSEGYGDDACTKRVRETLNGLIEKFPGFNFVYNRFFWKI